MTHVGDPVRGALTDHFRLVHEGDAVVLCERFGHGVTDVTATEDEHSRRTVSVVGVSAESL